MSPKYHDLPIRKRVCDELRQRGIDGTNQAVTAIVEAISRSPLGRVGDSDSLLLGLLCSGSYTIDTLEDCGVDPRELLEDTEDSVLYETTFSSSSLPNTGWNDPLEEFFDSNAPTPAAHLLEAIRSKHHIECADILRAAIVPSANSDVFRNMTARGWLNKQFRHLMTTGAEQMMSNMGLGDIRGRRRKLSQAERGLVLTKWGNKQDATRVADAFDLFVTGKNGEMYDLLCEFQYIEDLPLGARLFLGAGGDVSSLEGLLDSAGRLMPQRDQAGMFLFCQGSKVKAGQFTYRNSFFVDTGVKRGFPISRVSIEATRPISLLLPSVLEEFEAILSSENLKESEIQRFLNRHDEFLIALGYAGVRPHISLAEEGARDLVPDYILELPGKRGFDILDLKLPSARLTARLPYMRMSAELTKAVAQLRKYGTYFDKPDNRKEFQRRYGLTPFKPKLIVVIGRSSELQLPEDRVEIEAQLGHVELRTYDDLIEYGRTRQIDLPPCRFFD